MNELRVAEAVEISGLGLALFFEHDPDPVPLQHRLRIRVLRPDGTEQHFDAFREFARKVPPGEVIGFLVPAAKKGEVQWARWFQSSNMGTYNKPMHATCETHARDGQR